MEVFNTTARDIFLGEKSRRGTNLDVGRQGVRFPAGGTITVSDSLQRSPKFNELVDDGYLVVQSYSSDKSSELVHGEAVPGFDNLIIDTFTPSLSQTVFILSTTYLSGAFAQVRVNGLVYPDFTIVGNVATWTGPFSLDAGDTVSFEYISI